jgi:hypothetical protein
MNGIISAVGWSSARLVYSASAVSSVVFSLSSGFLAGYNLDLTPQRDFIHGLALSVVEHMEQRPYSGNWYQEPGPMVPESSQDPLLFVDASTNTQKRNPDPLLDIQNQAAQDEIQMTFSSALSADEQARLKELLILEQWKRTQTPKVSAKPRVRAEERVIPKPVSSPVVKVSGTDCSLTPGIQFQRTAEEKLDNQLCPDSASWLSKDWEGRGWVSAHVPGYKETLLHLPNPSPDAILLLDEADVASLEIRAGRRVQAGMGMVLGRIPEGYKVRFAGSAEQAQYFPKGNQKFFAMLNAEPGAGVVELISDANPRVSATVFAPVLENTVTYLELSSPQIRDLRVRVVKSGISRDPEVGNLTVSLSTHSGIQGITQSDGAVTLKEVSSVRGYPVYVDVSSRWGGTQSYTYRFQLKEQDANGVYLVREIPGDTLDHWLSQVGEGLSPQSALVLGAIERTRIDGFKFDYRMAVQSLNPKSGLEPSTYSVLWDDRVSQEDPLEGDQPRFLSVQVPEGLGRIQLLNEMDAPIKSDLFPISPRVIHVISP